jgi:hypothetical protein
MFCHSHGQISTMLKRLIMARKRNSIRGFLDKMKRLFRRTPDPPPADTYAYVPAPKKPKPSSRSAAAVIEAPE